MSAEAFLAGTANLRPACQPKLTRALRIHERTLVTLNFASWNRVVAWLKGIDELRRAA